MNTKRYRYYDHEREFFKGFALGATLGLVAGLICAWMVAEWLFYGSIR